MRHGQLLAIGGGEGVGAVGVYAESPFIGGGKALELAVGQGHIGAFVVEAVVLCGQSFPIGGVEYHHGVAVLQGGQVCDDAALAGGSSVQLIEGEIAGIAIGIAGNSLVLICSVLIVRAGISGQLRYRCLGPRR